jgi:hypothetical protein
LFREIMTGDQYNMETKLDAIRSFTQSDGDASTPGVAPHVLQARLNLVNTLQYDESDLMGKGMQLYWRFNWRPKSPARVRTNEK